MRRSQGITILSQFSLCFFCSSFLFVLLFEIKINWMDISHVSSHKNSSSCHCSNMSSSRVWQWIRSTQLSASVFFYSALVSTLILTHRDGPLMNTSKWAFTCLFVIVYREQNPKILLSMLVGQEEEKDDEVGWEVVYKPISILLRGQAWHFLTLIK